ncbi:LamB/YcsF family protein [Bacillus sinesaloumensis]|uniref:LamB/YcsF family protein n=1 Tax=Litchfieldia sinesaloumensis TaxID=1926280 RepID=UPI00098835FA|nr:5-oxoprolinase subunit PxpA [Bacillus sinesaloumensis]
MRPVIDIVADMGEGFGKYSIADDTKLLDLVSSANIACGFHAGDPQIMSQTVKQAIEKGVGIGAHPSFPDLVGFGRRKLDASTWEVTTDVLYQLGALSAFTKAHGGQIQHVTPHGALGNLVAIDSNYANAVLDAVELFDPNLIILSQPDELFFAAKERGLKTAAIIFADRAYNDEGKIVSRSEPNAVLHDPEVIVQRCLDMVINQKVTTITGKEIEVQGNSLLIHGDNKGSLELAEKIKTSLIDAGVEIQGIDKQLSTKTHT